MTRLTPSAEQRAILDSPLAPLRIAAGAGTGKTTTIGLVVEHLVTDLGIVPEEILGITFTTKAAAELSDRIRQLLAGDVTPGREAEVHTYHGFAASVVREFGALVGIERGASIITPTFSRQLLYEVIRNRRFQHFDPTWMGSIDKIQRIGAALGDHLADPATVVAAATDDVPWPERLELLAGWDDYRREKARLGAVDYADLISSAERILATHPDVVQRLRDRYQVVLLDEYQDTNPAQRVMLQRLFGDGFPVIAVGDADQTIYEWRGATASNFLAFGKHFPNSDGTPARETSLTVNRRSERLILDVANRIRTEIDPAADQLRPRPGAGTGRVAVRWLTDAVAEADWIADQVLRSHEEGVPWKEIAVLFRKNRHVGLVHDALAQRDIPVEVANLGGLLSVPQVADIRAWMQILHSPENGPALLRILLGPRFALGIGDLVHLSRWASELSRQEKRAREDRQIDPDLAQDHEQLPGHTMLEATDHLEEIEGLSERVKAALVRFRSEYRTLLEAAQGVSLAELARMILDETGAWRDVEAMGDAARLSARLNLYRFLDLAEEWSPLEGRPSLAAFLNHLAVMDDNPADELDAARLSGEDAVALLTVHRSKGLEWDVVFIPAVAHGTFPSKSSGFENPFTGAQWLPHEFRLDDPPHFDRDTPEKEAKDLLRSRHQTQEWRTAYVAVTRAARRLFLSGAYWYGAVKPTQKPVRPSDLFELVGAVEGVEDLGTDPLGDRPEILRTADRIQPPDPVFGDGWAAALRRAIENSDASDFSDDRMEKAVTERAEQFQQQLFSLETMASEPTSVLSATSVTGLVTYAACPRRFYWSEVDRLPRRPSPAARRGVDVHRRIELHSLGQVPLDGVEDDTYDLPEAETRDGQRGGSDPYETYLASPYAARRPLMVEVPFQFPTDSGLAIRGRIDAVYPAEHDTSGWEIVDFKSGRRRSEEWLKVQLQAYAVASRRVDFGHPPPGDLAVSFVYLGDGLDVTSVVAEPRWVDDAAERVENIADAITSERFDPEPSEACRSCEFSRFCGPGTDWLNG